MNNSEFDQSQLSDAELEQIYEKLQSPGSDPVENDVLRAKEVLQMIDRVRDQAQTETARPEQTQIDDFERLTAAEQELPRKIGRFEIKSQLGKGGFGLVFLARDPNLDRDVALKIPRPESVLTPTLKSRFLREGRAAGALTHPNIVPVYESGQSGSICYLASHYVDGQSLSEMMEAEDIRGNFRRIANIVRALADAIAHAHQRNVLHRDIKPANILITGDASEGDIRDHVQITDFGLAKDVSDQTEQTQTGALIGTPSYMSPEQASQKPAVPASDLYSIGCVLFELLTGKPPFSESNILSTIQAVMNKQPKAPRKFNQQVPKDLEAICLKCLEKEPDHRYQTGFELREDLDRFLSGEPVVARPVAPLVRAGRWFSRNRLVGSLMFSTIVALASGLAVSSHLYLKSEARLREVAAQEKLKDSSLRRAEETIDKMLTDVSNALKSYPNTKELRESLLNDALELQLEMLNEHGDDPVVVQRTLEAFSRIATLQYQMGLADASINTVEKGLDKYRSLPDEVQVSQNGIFGKTLLQRTKARRISQTHGNDKKAIQLLTDAIGDLRHLQKQDDLVRFRIAQALHARAKIYSQRSEWQMSLVDNLAAIQLFEEVNLVKMKHKTAMIKTDCEMATGWIYAQMGDKKKSVEVLTSCIASAKELVEALPDDVDFRQLYCLTLQYRASRFKNDHNFGKAIRDFDDLIASAGSMTEKVPQEYIFWNLLLRATSDRLDCLASQSDGDLESEFESAIELFEQISDRFGASSARSKMLARLYFSYGGYLRKKENLELAKEVSMEGLKVREAAMETLSPRAADRISYSQDLSQLGRITFEQNEFEDSISWFSKAYTIARELDEENSSGDVYLPQLNYCADHLVYNYYRVGKHDESIQLAKDISTRRPNAQQQLEAARFIGFVLEHLVMESELSSEEKSDLTAKYTKEAHTFWDKAMELEPGSAKQKLLSPFKYLFE